MSAGHTIGEALRVMQEANIVAAPVRAGDVPEGEPFQVLAARAGGRAGGAR
jgi:hypothetical protein